MTWKGLAELSTRTKWRVKILPMMMIKEKSLCGEAFLFVEKWFLDCE